MAASEQEGVASILQQATEALQQLPQEEEEPAEPVLARSAPVSGPPTPPVGLALSQPPGPTEQGLEERDMDCDVDPHPRGRAVPGADACEARLVAPTPPLAGFDTPSETRTPSLHGTPRQQLYYGTVPNHEAHSDGLMCMDQWGWKTDAPEFIPGRMKGLVDAAGTTGYQCAWAISPTNASGRGGGSSDGIGSDGDRLSQVWVQYEWQLKSKADKLREMQSNMNRVEFEVAEIRASREIERRSLVRQIGQYRAVLERYCIPLEEASGASFSSADDNRTGHPADFELSSHASGSRAVGRPGTGTAPCKSSDPACGSDHGPGFAEPHSHTASPPALAAAYGGGPAAAGADGCLSGGAASEPAPPASSLDSKMRQLNSLLQERNAHGQRQRSSTSDNNNVLDGGEPQEPNAGVKPAGGDYSSGSIASTLRAMFPHATIRTSRADSAGEERDAHGTEATGSDASEGFTVEQQLRRLERSTGCQVDDRAMRSLRALSAKDARDALGKAEKLVDSQGGTCRNLSSILQSVCRKIEKRVGRAARQHQEEPPRAARSGGATAAPVVQEAAAGTATRGGAGAATGGGSAECPRSQRRVRHLDEDGDAFDDSSESTGDGGPKNPAEQTDPPHGASPHACEDVRVQTVEEDT